MTVKKQKSYSTMSDLLGRERVFSDKSVKSLKTIVAGNPSSGKSSVMSIPEFKAHKEKEEAKKKSKYRNRIIKNKYGTFHSTKEYEYFLHLNDRQLKGEIVDLRMQVVFPLYVGTIKICDYIADFVYTQAHGVGKYSNSENTTVDDVKGMRREKYRDKTTGKMKSRSNAAYEMFLLKKKLMLACLGITVNEI